jgi:hypothetical protein
MYLKTFFIFLASFVLITHGEEPNRFVDMTNRQIDHLLTEESKTNKTITERMFIYSEYFLDMPYSWTCTGDGIDALYEPQPLVNFDSTNCMVYCEHVLALSISDSWDNFFNNLQQIRYKDGIIGMRTRNHYTMADWMPQNSWLLDDVTASIGAGSTRKLTRNISHKQFFENKGIKDLRYVLPDRKIAIDYIPKEHLSEIKDGFKSGDIGVLIFSNLDNIFAAHMWMVFKKKGKLIVREASTRGMTTFDTDYDVWASRIKKNKRYIGISIMRIKDTLNKPGKIILPWSVSTMK